MSILIDIVISTIKNEFLKQEPVWNRITPDEDDLTFLKNECMTYSEFDPFHTKKDIYFKWQSGELSYYTYQCLYGKLCIIAHPNQLEDIPFGLWGRILRLYYEESGTHIDSTPFRIFFLANTHLRKFPTHGPITPHNINGGYTLQCHHDTIVIYRAEDATRVLLHELQHSCCLDRQIGLDQIEAETEAWAELLYIGFLSKGNKRLFMKLLQTQINWIVSQNHKIYTYIHNPTDFPYRYTIAKEHVWKRWDLLHNAVLYDSNSLRLTAYPSLSIKQSFNISDKSNML